MHTVFLDFHKAFDRVWHAGLLHKLAQIGVGPSACDWLRNYLSARCLRVRVGTDLSSPHTTSAGVPQGSHLGPVLFLVFIDDLPAATPETSLELYADDALLHNEIRKLVRSTSDRVPLLATSVQAAFDWARSWRGQFSLGKTVALALGAPAQSLQLTSPLTVDRETIIHVASHKHLGLTLSNNLRWHDHVTKLLSAGRKQAGLFRHICYDVRPDVASKLYLTQIRPTFEYACQVWHFGLDEGDAIALEKVQASIARSILRAEWRTPKHELLQALGWPSLRWRRTILSMKMIHSLLYGNKNGPLASCLYPTSHTALRKPKQLLLPRARTTCRTKSFFFTASCLWNTLPTHIQDISSSEAFVSAVEDHWAAYKHNTHNCPQELIKQYK